MPPRGLRSARKGARPLPPDVAPAPAAVPGTHSVPGYMRQGASQVVTQNAPGPGEAALDALCARNGWTWAKVATYDQQGKPRMAILVGSIIQADMPDGIPANPHQARQVEDAGLADIAAYLAQYDREG